MGSLVDFTILNIKASQTNEMTFNAILDYVYTENNNIDTAKIPVSIFKTDRSVYCRGKLPCGGIVTIGLGNTLTLLYDDRYNYDLLITGLVNYSSIKDNQKYASDDLGSWYWETLFKSTYGPSTCKLINRVNWRKNGLHFKKLNEREVISDKLKLAKIYNDLLLQEYYTFLLE